VVDRPFNRRHDAAETIQAFSAVQRGLRPHSTPLTN
jgi:hypothetical protein